MSSVSGVSPETQARKHPPPTSDSKRPSAATNLVEEIRNHPGKSGLKPAKTKPDQVLLSAMKQRRSAIGMSLSDNITCTEN